MDKQKALFIINPISGTGKQSVFFETLDQYFDSTQFTFEKVFTERRGHATEISRNACNSYDLIVSVGGDGTVNEVAKGLIGSTCKMGIIPVGSGNGLARHLRIPLKIKDALEIINQGQSMAIDTATINGEHFVNVAGIGFDAHIAHLYAKTSKRGPIPYVKMATQEFQKYKSKDYEVIIEGQSYRLNAFLISFANSAQFGNNAYISPHAIINDGLLDVCLMNDFPKVEAGQLAIKLFNKRLDKSRYMKIVRGTHIIVKSEEGIKGHIDGEPIMLPNEIEVLVNQGALNIIYNPAISMLELISNKIKNI
jgi:YegS/Rv2252/BmrU family lipid kinase